MMAKTMSSCKKQLLTALAIGTCATTISCPVCAQDTQAAPAPAQQPVTPAPLPAPQASNAAMGNVSSITVTGSQRIEPDTVRSYIQLHVGDAYNRGSLDQVIHDLMATDLFADVVVRDTQGAVTIDVKENPVVNRVLFEGNTRLKEDKLNPEIKLNPRDIYTRSKVRADVTRILELYRRQGRYGANVSPKLVQLEQNRVDVVYEINEGPKSRVRQINIIGNHVFKEPMLQQQMATKIAGFKHFMSSSTSYDSDRLAYDQQKLRQFYLTQGYADFRVISATAELTPDKRDFTITYVVEEGQRYKFGAVKVESEIRDLKSDLLQRLLPMRKGDQYNAKLVEDTVDSLNKQAGIFGYAYADTSPQFQRDEKTHTMGITFKVGETPRAYVEAIKINGNTHTRDKVVRREFRMAEGDAYNNLQVSRSQDRVQALGYFQDKLEVKQTTGSAADRVVLSTDLEEKNSGELNFSAGYSSIEHLVFSAGIRQRNFRGMGQDLHFNGSISTYSNSLGVGFTEPYLFDKNISYGVDVFRNGYSSFNYVGTNRNTTYKQTTVGFSNRLGVPLNEFWTLLGSYGWSSENVALNASNYSIDGVHCSVLLASRYLCDLTNGGLSTNRSRSTLGLSIIHNSLNNPQHPTSGSLFSLSTQINGPGGSVRNIKTLANFSTHKDLGKGLIVSASVEGGAVIPLRGNANTDPVLLTDRFFLGEPQMAGFDIRGVGPRVVRNYIGNTAAAFAGDGLSCAGTSGGVSTGSSVNISAGTASCPGGASLSSLSGTSSAGFASYCDPLTQPSGNCSYTNQTFDAIGGRYYYKGRFEVELPLGQGVKELGLRPSLFVDVGSVWGVRTPSLITAGDTKTAYFQYQDTDGSLKYYPYYASLGKSSNGNQLYLVTSSGTTYNNASVYGATTTCAKGYSPNLVAPNDPSCTTSLNGNTVTNPGTNSPNRPIPVFNESYFGGGASPRISVGVGVNWQSPMGPLRINLAKAIMYSPGDQLKLFSFNVGASF